MRTIVLLLLLPIASSADALEDARLAHAKELTRLRTEMLASFDAQLRANERAGKGIDYLLPEKKAFVESGVTPLLPEMQEATRQYLAGKKAANEALAIALERAGRAIEAKRLRDEFAAAPAKPEKATNVQTAAQLQKFLEDTKWDWVEGEAILKWDGKFIVDPFRKGNMDVRWSAVDRRTVLVMIAKGRDKDTLAVLTFSENLDSVRAIGFGGKDWTKTLYRRK